MATFQLLAGDGLYSFIQLTHQPQPFSSLTSPCFPYIMDHDLDPRVEITNTIFNWMMSDAILDLALESHSFIRRGRGVCSICGLICKHTGSHAPPISTSVNRSSTNSPAPNSRASTPAPSSAFPLSASKDFNTPTTDPSSGNVFYNCINCNRPTVSNRYAPHLSKCLGLGQNRRATTARAATAQRAINGSDQAGGSDAEQRNKFLSDSKYKKASTVSKPPKPKKTKMAAKTPVPASAMPASYSTKTLPGQQPYSAPSNLNYGNRNYSNTLSDTGFEEDNDEDSEPGDSVVRSRANEADGDGEDDGTPLNFDGDYMDVDGDMVDTDSSDD